MRKLTKDSSYWVVESEEDLDSQKCKVCGETLIVSTTHWTGGLSNAFLICPKRHNLEDKTKYHTCMCLWLIRPLTEWLQKRKRV